MNHLEGRILAQAVTSPEDVPSFDRSMVDGFAVIAKTCEPRRAKIRRAFACVGRSADGQGSAGAPRARMRSHRSDRRCATQGERPASSRVEDTETNDAEVLVFDGLDCADRINRARSDVSKGELLFEPGRVLDPPALGLLAAAGIDAVDVYVSPSHRGAHHG